MDLTWSLGRIDDMLNVSGHLLSTSEVESALMTHPSVAEAAAVARPHATKGECIHCFVVLKSALVIPSSASTPASLSVISDMSASGFSESSLSSVLQKSTHETNPVGVGGPDLVDKPCDTVLRTSVAMSNGLEVFDKVTTSHNLMDVWENESGGLPSQLRNELVSIVRSKIGPFATPDHVQRADALPKTRSGKLIRRFLRQIANHEEICGDKSSLADPLCLDKLIALSRLT
ncbi:unnamed protein product [Protopolystoma xenopodis]|uniref:AMP-binding enzyme C-terminal domain-containing protein n=1 Tax=Protopolystoma xenopodis TaxID=117903 RepID=A0A3S5C4E8_9PLAT|nr:unnamed protein product [Protopolystoma xenopodis]